MSQVRRIDLTSLIRQAMEIRAPYARLEQQKYGKAWTTVELALGMGKDLGDTAVFLVEERDGGPSESRRHLMALEIAEPLWDFLVIGVLDEIALPEAIEPVDATGDAPEVVALRLVGHIGRIMKLVAARAGTREVEDLETTFAATLATAIQELAELAALFDIHLERAFSDLMSALDTKVAE